MVKNYCRCAIAAVLMVLCLCACGEADLPVNTIPEPVEESTKENAVQTLPETSLSETPTTSYEEFEASEKNFHSYTAPADVLTEIAKALPGSYSCGEFDEMLGNHGGGIPVYDSAGSLCGFIEVNHATSPIFVDGKLSGVSPFDNHASFVSEFTSLDTATPCVYAEYSQDVYDYEQNHYTGTEESWYVFWAKDGCVPVYAANLLKSSIAQEEIAIFAKEVSVPDSAFSSADVAR